MLTGSERLSGSARCSWSCCWTDGGVTCSLTIHDEGVAGAGEKPAVILWQDLETKHAIARLFATLAGEHDAGWIKRRASVV